MTTLKVTVELPAGVDTVPGFIADLDSWAARYGAKVTAFEAVRPPDPNEEHSRVDL